MAQNIDSLIQDLRSAIRVEAKAELEVDGCTEKIKQAFSPGGPKPVGNHPSEQGLKPV